MTPSTTDHGASTGSTPAAATYTSQAPPLAEVAGKVAYITGASSGIGLATARVLREAGMKVVLGYVADDQIEHAMSFFQPDDPDVFAIRHDVMEFDAWERTARAIDQCYGRTHLLVNNAGVGLNSRVTSGTLNDWEWGMGVNFWGPVYGMKTFLPRMRAHNEGAHIATVSSISGMFAGSPNGIYSVTKHASCALMEQLRTELHETNIGTSVMLPGLTVTNIANSESYRPERYRNPDGTPVFSPNLPPDSTMMDPVENAYCLLDGIRHNDLFIFSHPEWKAGSQARCDAVMASFIDCPVPAARMPPNPYRTPVYLGEIEHRRRSVRRNIRTI